jgi:nucleoid DNA-binding protein
MLPSFGSFSTVKHDESIITDISTGKHMLMPPCIEVEFTPSNILNKHIAANE